jgi:hypothetical protein
MQRLCPGRLGGSMFARNISSYKITRRHGFDDPNSIKILDFSFSVILDTGWAEKGSEFESR